MAPGVSRLQGRVAVITAPAFLFSDDAAFRTGEILPVDGGRHTKGSAG